MFSKEGCLRKRKVIRGSLRRLALEVTQRAWLGHRQRPQDHKIEKTESRYVDADTERQHEHCGQREARGPSQHASCVSEVLRKAIDPGPAPGISRFFTQTKS